MSRELARAIPDAGSPDPEARRLAQTVIEAGQDLDFDVEAAYKRWRDSANATDDLPVTIDEFHDVRQLLIESSTEQNRFD